jgi:type I restriction enzyme S subunit
MSVPRLRFKDEDGREFAKWEEKTIADIADKVSAGATPSTLKKEYWGGAIRWMNSGELNLKKVFEVENRITKIGLDNSSTKLIPPKCVLIGLAGQGKTRGTVAMNMVELCTNQSIAAIHPKPDVFNEDFLFQNLDFRYDELRSLSTGDGGRGGLNLQIIKSMVIPLPSILEQTKIANFLTAIDEKITHLTQKHVLLTQYKKGLMQQIFSQKLRFKDEDGREFAEWEEKRLGDISNIKRGASPRPISDKKWFSSKSTIGWVRISDVSSSNKYLNFTDQYLSEAGINKSRLVKQGNIIMSICATIGKPIYTNFDVCIHDGFVVFEDLQINHEYLYYFLMLIEKKWYQYGQPGSQVNLNSDIVSNEIILIPSSAEQTKIANFLTAIDDKITATKAQLTAMKQYKQGLLQQMFV